MKSAVIALGALLALFVLLVTQHSLLAGLALAFNPPTGSGGIGGGAIGVDAGNNIAIGTSTSGLDSKVLIYATSSNTFFLKVLSPTASPILVVKSDGKVGIATSTPVSTLTVQGDLTVTGIISGIFNGQLNGTVSAANVSNGVFGSLVGGGNYSFPSSLGIATSSQIGLPQALSVYGGGYFSGNVGIGTVSPNSKLHVAGVVQANNLYVQGDIVTTVVRTTRTDNTQQGLLRSNGWGDFTFDRSLAVGYDLAGAGFGAGNLYISGNVGIGTTNPQYNLDVSGGARVTDLRIATTSAQAGYVWKATDTQGNGAWQVDATGLAGGQANYVPVWTSATTQGTSTIYQSPLGPTGSIGIGTITPNNLLQVKDLISFNNTDFNTQIGYRAGLNIVSGAQYNTFIGYQSGRASPSGSTNAADSNTGIGYQTLYSNANGNFNSAMGSSALYSNTSGYNNSAMGSSALYSNDTGNSNSAMGYTALYANTAGIANSAMGIYSLRFNNTGNGNSAVGTSALFSNTAGSYNTALGYLAGYGTTGSYNIIIGQNVEAPLVAGSQQLNIGNLIYGTGVYNGSAVSSTPATGNIGIGTTNPPYRLTVTDGSAPELSDAGIATPAVISIQGDGRAYFMGRDVTNNIEFLFGTSVAGEVFAGSMTAHDMSLRTNNTNRLTIKANTGNVGIDSAAPGSKLTVASGDVFVASSTRGIILKAPDGHCARVQLSNSPSTLTLTDVTCPGT